MHNIDHQLEWIKEEFKNNNIIISLEHKGYYNNVFKGEDIESKIDAFFDLFSSYLFLNELKEIREFRGVGQSCSECGKIVAYMYDTEKKEIVDFTRNSETKELERCGCKEISDYSFEVSFPTGEILCHDRLPHSYDMLKHLDNNHEVNSQLGKKECTLDYAKEDIFHIFVGNSSPDVFKQDNLLAVGHSDSNELSTCSCGAEYGCDCDYEEYYPMDNCEKIASICTDLWWTSIVDIETYKKLLINYFGEETAKTYIKELEPIKTKIKPGVYRCNNPKKDSNDDYYNYPTVLATLEWVRDND